MKIVKTKNGGWSSEAVDVVSDESKVYVTEFLHDLEDREDFTTVRVHPKGAASVSNHDLSQSIDVEQPFVVIAYGESSEVETIIFLSHWQLKDLFENPNTQDVLNRTSVYRGEEKPNGRV